MSYAENTKVPVFKSQGEIKNILTKYGATAFAFAESQDKAMIQFEVNNRMIKFILPLPQKGKAKNKKGVLYSQNQIEQLIRAKWRSMALAIKAKLECVDAGITTLEQEFMAHIVLPNGSTVGDLVLPEIATSYQTGQMPLLLGMG